MNKAEQVETNAKPGNLRLLNTRIGQIQITETHDFPLTDPWSRHTRRTISVIEEKGGFGGDFFEAGIGDARNPLTAGVHKKNGNVTGVDIDGWRLDLAHDNLLRVGTQKERLNLVNGDVVEVLQQSKDRLSGWGIACLPQAPGFETKNNADGFDSRLDSLRNVRGMQLDGHDVDEVGLTLNAAFLVALRQRTSPDKFNLLLTMSDRISPEIRSDLFKQTGWRVEAQHDTEVPVQQDPDTGVSYVKPFDDGKRFFERRRGLYTPISAAEAEKRRSASEQNGGRGSLNVFHHLTIYHLQPASNVVYERK